MSLLNNVQRWCLRHHVPYIHGCIWDRECRADGAPARISVLWGRSMIWVDLPGYWMDWEPVDDRHVTRRRSWHGIHFGYTKRPTD